LGPFDVTGSVRLAFRSALSESTAYARRSRHIMRAARHLTCGARSPRSSDRDESGCAADRGIPPNLDSRTHPFPNTRQSPGKLRHKAPASTPPASALGQDDQEWVRRERMLSKLGLAGCLRGLRHENLK
jgi:hypothetical protein